MSWPASWWWPGRPPRIPKAQIAWLLTALGIVIFGASSGLVRAGVTSWDGHLLQDLNEVPAGAASELTPFSRLFLPVGITVVVLVIIVYVVARNRSVLPVAAAALAAGAAWALANGAKAVALRARPYQAVTGAVLRQQPAHGTSFPSSHTAITLAVVIALVPFLTRLLAAAAIVYAVLVGWSRVYLGVHYPLDVLAGAGVGMAVGGAILLILGMLFRRPHRPASDPHAAVQAQPPHGRPSPGDPCQPRHPARWPAELLNAAGPGF